MKKALKGTLIGILALIALLAVTYCMMGLYYMGGFPCYTWINGVYCTGKTVSEVNRELVQKDGYEGIAIMDKDGARLFITTQDAGMNIDYTGPLSETFNNRNPLAWGVNVFKNLTLSYSPNVTIDRQKLESVVSDWEIFVDPDQFECSIVKTQDGYSLENDYVTVPVKEKVTQHVFDSMMNMDSVIDLSNFSDCYRDVDLRGSEKEKMDLFSKIDRLQSGQVVYKVGDETVLLDGSKISDFLLTEKDLESAVEEKVNKKYPGQGQFIIAGEETSLPDPESLNVIEGIVVDENGNPVISESRMYDFLAKIGSSHSTAWMMERYRDGETSTVIINKSSKGDGQILDIDSEFDHLKEEMLSGEQLSEVRQFQLSKNAEVHDAEAEIGKTYIEINMGNQMLCYYVDGKKSMTMPIVTGNINRSRGTPTGIYPVYNKRYHTNLVGADYVSYVNYWLGVHKGVGIHDALWRDKFGEEIYKSEGSHGCINCPLDTVEKLWEVVDVGTPVVLYY